MSDHVMIMLTSYDDPTLSVVKTGKYTELTVKPINAIATIINQYCVP